MTYFAPICFPQSNLFDDKLLFAEASILKINWNRYLPYVASSVTYPVVATIALLGLFFLKLESYSRLQEERRLAKRIEHIQRLSHDETHVLLALRVQTLESRRRELTQGYQESLRSFGFQNKVSFQRLKAAYEEQIGLTAQSSFTFYQKKDKTAELKACVRLILDYKRLEKELTVYRTCRENVSDLKRIFIERLKFTQLCHKITRKCWQHFVSNCYLALTPLTGLSCLLESHQTTKIVLQKSGLVSEYNRRLEQYPWFKPFAFQGFFKGLSVFS